jgi:hypothetical protein
MGAQFHPPSIPPDPRWVHPKISIAERIDRLRLHCQDGNKWTSFPGLKFIGVSTDHERKRQSLNALIETISAPDADRPGGVTPLEERLAVLPAEVKSGCPNDAGLLLIRMRERAIFGRRYAQRTVRLP